MTNEELLFQSALTRVVRRRNSSGSVIVKQPLGPEAERRLRREAALLERLKGVDHWFAPLEQGIVDTERSRAGELQAGDLQFASVTFSSTLMLGLNCWPTLERSLEEVEAGLAFCARTGSQIGRPLMLSRLPAFYWGAVLYWLHGLALASDKGPPLVHYLEQLADYLTSERRELAAELERLHRNVDHIKEIVGMQQDFARVSGLRETDDCRMEDALAMHRNSEGEVGVALERDYQPVTLEVHKALQILVNLLSNARRACLESSRLDRRIRVSLAASDGVLRTAVADNGVGISSENPTRIFSHGFTTRSGGHGFGLHSAALVARELGGRLAVESAGPDQGATFTLELPLDG